MSELHRLAAQKALLVARVRLQRLQVRYETRLVRHSLRNTPVMRGMASAVALFNAVRAIVRPG